jgi:hypothetical protein
MNRFAKGLFRTGSLLAAVVVMERATFASVDDAQSFALQAAEPYVKQGFQVREDYWGGDLASGEKKKRCGSNCSKGTNIGSGWEQKSTEQRSPFTFMIRTENWRKNQTAGKKGVSLLRIS